MKTEINALVAEGKVDEALDRLVSYLEGQIDQYSPLYRAAQVARSEYNLNKEKELQGILTEEQIRLANNQAINKVLEILEQLERSNAAATTSSKNLNWLYGVLGVCVLVIIVLLTRNGSSTMKPGNPPQPTVEDSISGQEKPIFTCPRFAKNTVYPIAIFQFTTLNPKDSLTDQLLVEAIDAIFARNNYKGDAALCVKINGLVDAEVAREFLEACGVKMVIWGRVFDNSEIDLNFYAPNISASQQAQLDSLLQFREQGNFQASIRQAALIIASRVLVMNDASGAIAVTNEAFEETIKNPTPATASAKRKNTETMAVMNLANAHARAKHYDQSIRLYDQILVKKPKDTIAWRNKAIIQIQSNDLQGAISSVDSMRKHQKLEDPVFLDRTGEALREKGLTRKGVELQSEAQRAKRQMDLQQTKNLLPKE